MTWYDVEVTLDGDYIRRYAIEADSVADADKIALARIPEFNVAVNPLGGEPDDDIELNFDAVIPRPEVAQGKGVRLLCTFVPQAWINDNAVTVDHMEGREYQWIVNLPGRDVPPEPHSYETDALREGTDAPLWVQDWTGPFEVEYEVLPHSGVARSEVAQGEVGTIVVNEVDGRVASVNGAPPGYVIIARDWDAGDTPDENGDLYEDRTL